MKRTFLLIVVSVLLVTLGFAQTPAASGNTDQINIKGCLGGSEGNYTVAEDGTGKIFKITTSSADLKPHVGHEVTLIGSKTVAAENSVAITEVNMISEHCTAAAGVPAETTSALPAPPAVTGCTRCDCYNAFRVCHRAFCCRSTGCKRQRTCGDGGHTSCSRRSTGPGTRCNRSHAF